MKTPYLGPKYEIDSKEEAIISDDTPAVIEILQEGFFSQRNLIGDLADVEDVEQAYAIPYLTNKKILLWLLVISKKLGPIGKWWEMPIEFIKDVKFRDAKNDIGGVEIVYKVPHLEKGLGRRVLGLGRGKESFKIILYTKSIPVWKTNITKLMFSIKANSLVPQLEKLKKEISGFEDKLEKLEHSLMKGKISEKKYDDLKEKYEDKLEELKDQLKKDEKELKEIQV